MNIRLLFGCLCVGNGLVGFSSRIMYNVNFDIAGVVIIILSFAVGFYLIHDELKKSK